MDLQAACVYLRAVQVEPKAASRALGHLNGLGELASRRRLLGGPLRQHRRALRRLVRVLIKCLRNKRRCCFQGTNKGVELCSISGSSLIVSRIELCKRVWVRSARAFQDDMQGECLHLEDYREIPEIASVHDANVGIMKASILFDS